MRNMRTGLVMGGVCLACVNGFAVATERHVPSQYATIQAAINACVNGDVVTLADGTYTGLGNRDVDFLGNEITVRSAHGPLNCTIDCQAAGRAFVFPTQQAFVARIEGLHITNGNAWALSDEQWGGAICSWGARVNIVDCIFAGNAAESGGAVATIALYEHEITGCTFAENVAGDSGGAIHNNGPISIRNCAVIGNQAKVGGGIVSHGGEIVDCEISDNTVLAEWAISGSGGGGIYAYSVHVVGCALSGNRVIYTIPSSDDCGGGGIRFVGPGNQLWNCSMTYNTVEVGAPQDGRGGGVYATDGGGNDELIVVGCDFVGNQANWGGAAAGNVTLVGCRVQSNHADYAGGGVFMVGMAAYKRLENTLVIGNSAGWYGGGAYVFNGYGTFCNATFRSNTAGVYGGALYSESSVCDIGNCILWADSATAGPEIAADDDAWVKVCYSDVAGGLAAVWVEGTSYVVWGEGAGDANPQFSSGGDSHLSLTSPCIDGGHVDWVPPDRADLDGDGDIEEPVPFDYDGGPRVARFIVDIGAYEVPFGDLNCDGRIDFGDINPFVLVLSNSSAWQAAYPGCELLYADINADGEVGFADINPFVTALAGG